MLKKSFFFFLGGGGLFERVIIYKNKQRNICSKYGAVISTSISILFILLFRIIMYCTYILYRIFLKHVCNHFNLFSASVHLRDFVVYSRKIDSFIQGAKTFLLVSYTY